MALQTAILLNLMSLRLGAETQFSTFRQLSRISVLAAAVLAVQLAAVHVERARYRAAEDAVASSATRSDIETRLGLPRELAGEQVFLDGPVLSTNLVLKDEWRYNFDSPLSPFAFSHDLVIGFRPDDTIDYAYWARFGLPPSAIPFAQSPATPSAAEETHAESAETEPHAESAKSAENAELLPEQIGVGPRPHEGEDEDIVPDQVDE